MAMPSVRKVPPTVALLAPASSTHVVNWCNTLAERGWKVVCLSLSPPIADAYHPSIEVDELKPGGAAGSLLSAHQARRKLNLLRPSVVHAHYATTYGLLARQAGRPYILSVWGSDVFEFPAKSPWHRRLVASNLAAAAIVCATSQVMARQVLSLASSLTDVEVTPFGVDTRRFFPARERRSGDFVLGTVKALYPCYGIDVLIRAFGYLRGIVAGEVNTQLHIVGRGPEEPSLRRLVKDLGLNNHVIFTGHIPNTEVPNVLRRFDVFACLSRDESFGVAALEASSCALPVVATAVGGLPEVVRDGQTGFLVPRDNPEAAGDAVLALLNDRELARKFGTQGRAMVEAAFSKEAAAARMESVYSRFVELTA